MIMITMFGPAHLLILLFLSVTVITITITIIVGIVTIKQELSDLFVIHPHKVNW